MTAGTPVAFALIRIPRGAPRPSDDAFQQAIAEDRQRLRLPANNGYVDFGVAGPYAVVVDGAELDEYAVWEK